MKLSVFLLIITLASDLNIFAQTNLADTTFISRDTTGGVYHAVFIDKDKSSKYYNRIADFQFGHFDSLSFKSSVEFLQGRNPAPFEKKNLSTVPRQWCSLYFYKGNYYLYAPSDYLFNYCLMISDTAYIDYSGEGPEASRINSFIKMDNTTYKFSLTTYQDTDRVVIIHIIDMQKGIAVFEEPSEAEDRKFYLMVSTDKMRQFPIIVNYCKTQKQSEFELDIPDFQKLLKSK